MDILLMLRVPESLLKLMLVSGFWIMALGLYFTLVPPIAGDSFLFWKLFEVLWNCPVGY